VQRGLLFPLLVLLFLGGNDIRDLIELIFPLFVPFFQLFDFIKKLASGPKIGLAELSPSSHQSRRQRNPPPESLP
jgi:hypothetical protein